MPEAKKQKTGGSSKKANGALAPASYEASAGWRVKLFWPAIGKDFSGVVLGYDAPSKNHTVRWDNAPGGSSGVTEVCIDEGVVTWLAPPESSLAAGGGSSKGGSSSKPQKTPEKKKDKDGGAPKEAKPPKEVSKETLEEVQARIGSGTIKGICFRVLKNAGAHGMLLSEIVETTQKLGLKDWTSVRQPSNTVNACCSGDPAFVKVAPGRVGLACLGAAESPDLAAREEREHGEKVLYCEACRGGPFNTKGMRMHISRWCAYAPGNAKEHEGRVPRAVTDKAAAAIDNAAAAQAAAERERANANKNAEAKGKGGGGAGKSGAKGGGGGGGCGGGGDDGSQVKTLACELCGAGPFNDKGMAMHASRWCKARPDDGGVGSLNPFSALGFGSPLDGGLASAFGGSRKRKKSEKQEDEFNPATLFPASPPKSAAPGSFSTGMDLAAMFNNLVPPIVGGGGGSGAAGGGGGFARGLMDMMARTLSGGAFSGAFSGGFSGGVLGGGQVVNQTKSDAEQPEPQEMKVDVEVYKDDGTFVARAPLVVPVDVTLMGLKLAVEDNTKGALPPHRQLLKKDGVPFPEGEEEKPLREFVGGDVSGKINLHLTIVDD